MAGVCAWLVYRLVGARVAASKPVATMQVVTAAKDIPLGAVLTTADLTTMSIAGAPPKGAILKPEDAVGRGVISEIYQGEPVLESRLAGLGSGGGLAATIPAGHESLRGEGGRSGGRGWIRDFRACAWTFWCPVIRPARGGQPTALKTKTILQNIQVLSAGTDIQKDARGQAAAGAGGEPAGDSRAGRDAEPGQQSAEDPTGAAQSAGHADRAGAAHGDEQHVCGDSSRAAHRARRRRHESRRRRRIRSSISNGSKTTRREISITRGAALRAKTGITIAYFSALLLVASLRRAARAGSGRAVFPRHPREPRSRTPRMS